MKFVDLIGEKGASCIRSRIERNMEWCLRIDTQMSMRTPFNQHYNCECCCFCNRHFTVQVRGHSPLFNIYLIMFVHFTFFLIYIASRVMPSVLCARFFCLIWWQTRYLQIICVWINMIRKIRRYLFVKCDLHSQWSSVGPSNFFHLCWRWQCLSYFSFRHERQQKRCWSHTTNQPTAKTHKRRRRRKR